VVIECPFLALSCEQFVMAPGLAPHPIFNPVSFRDVAFDWRPRPEQVSAQGSVQYKQTNQRIFYLNPMPLVEIKPECPRRAHIR
jgi:hypothetical protein